MSGTKADQTLQGLIEQYQQVVHKLATALVSDRRDVEEIASDVWLAAWNRIRYVPGSPRSWQAWLLTVTRRRAVDLLRKRPAAPPMFDLRTLRECPEAERDFDRADARIAVLGVLRTTARAVLSDNELVAVILAAEQMPYEQIAVVIGVPKNAVGSIRRRALVKLREAIPTGGQRRPATSRPAGRKG